jgi:Bacterial transcriptional activator domain/Family of unknown function (DUF6221)
VLRDRFVPALEQRRLQALEDHAEAELQLGRHDWLIPQLRDLAAQHPVRERFHAQLMEALARAGRQAEALEAYRHARRALVNELGIEPGPHLQLLHQQIMNGDPALAAPPADRDAPQPPVMGPASSSPAVVPRQLRAAAFLEARYKEIEAAGRRATGGPWTAFGQSEHSGTAVYAGDIQVIRHTRPREAEHIVLHDPRAVLADVAARRRILARHHDDGHGYCAACPPQYKTGECPELRDLAQAFRERPDFPAELDAD